jgi:endothelin-converting enzyme
MNLQKLAASTDEENFLTMQESYTACMNETTLKAIGVKPLTELIDDVAQSFPVTDDTAELLPEDYAKLSDTILLLEELGVTSFESLYTGADDKNPVCLTTPPARFLVSHRYRMW